MSDSALKLERISDRGYLNLRGDAQNARFASAVENVAGIALPDLPNTTAGEDPKVFWLGPNEWLLVGAAGAVVGYSTALEKALQREFAAINDLSGGLVCYRLSGNRACDLLAGGCTLDLHAPVMDSGKCAQSGLAKASVLLSGSAQGNGYDIIVRRSFSDYLWQWLVHAGRNIGIEVA
jgi:sarcosine oxidase subunit gamma